MSETGWFRRELDATQAEISSWQKPKQNQTSVARFESSEVRTGLNVAEILRLQEGEEIIVTWSGCDGPARYIVTWEDSLPYAAVKRRYDTELQIVDPLLYSRASTDCIHHVERAP